jgi:hypothetical protein
MKYWGSIVNVGSVAGLMGGAQACDDQRRGCEHDDDAGH